MAKREGQGLQIALILLVMLTVILCIATYFFWSQSQKLAKEVESKKEEISNANTARNKMIDENLKLRQFLGAGDSSAESIEQIEQDYTEHMRLYGQGVAEGERNYRGLPEQLVKVVQERNQSIADLTAAESKLKEDHKTKLDGMQKNLDETLAKWKQAEADSKEWKRKFDETSTELRTLVSKVERDYGTARRKLDVENRKLRNQLKAVTENEATLRSRVEEMDKKLARVQRKTFERADGKITFVNQRSKFVYLNLGRADSLQRQATFSVYDVDENNLARSEPKGSIEVTRLLGDHLAEARILEDSFTDPIISGDLIFSPLWEAGQPVRFALIGKLDVDDDGADDRDLIKNLISLNGGIVDAELDEKGNRSGDMSIETRYLILGENVRRDEASVRQFRQMREDAKTFGASEVPLGRFLNDIGYQSVGRTVAMGSRATAADYRSKREDKGTGRFRPRTPPVRKLDRDVE